MRSSPLDKNMPQLILRKRSGCRPGLGIEMNPPTEPPAPSFLSYIAAFSFPRTYWVPELTSLSYSA